MVALTVRRGVILSKQDNLLHGTGLAIDGKGVLLRGPSGAGKSDLALRLIEDGRAELVADDQTLLVFQDGGIMITAPETIRGLLEVRGVGIVPVETAPQAPLSLIVDLVPPEDIERLPEPKSERHGGFNIPVIDLTPFEASAPSKLCMALRVLTNASRAEAAE